MTRRYPSVRDLWAAIAAKVAHAPPPLAGVLRFMCTNSACALYRDTGPLIGIKSDISGRALYCASCESILEAVRTSA